MSHNPLEQQPTQTSIQQQVFEEILGLVKSYNKNEKELELLVKAYNLAADAHKEQFRASGEPYIVHPLEVAKILAQVHMDIPTLTAAILHDVVEDTKIENDQLAEIFGREVASLVDGVTKLTAISASKQQNQSRQKTKVKVDKQAENLKKIFLAMARDIRVILIKVADRLHNLRTLDALPPHKQKYISQESLEIFAPIAARLGMWEFKWQIEDLAFKYLFPEDYLELVESVAKKRQEREKTLEPVKQTIQKTLAGVGVKDAKIEGRPKHLYSIFQKMQKKKCTLDEIYDLTAVRIIVKTVRECYQVLGIIHNLWMPFQERFKDYIALPKSNNYRSLHTTVYGPGNEPLEVQIRTNEMHQVNEFGIAAHWAYKETGKTDINVTKDIYPWIRKILDFQDDSRDAREYIENLKLDLLDSEVFVFTPRGDVIDLPAGSTPIDFAYSIHTEVGHRCIGAKVNSKIVPIEYRLKNADIIEILTSKHGTPSLDWLKFCQSNNAKNKIRQWFKKEKREENIERGKEMIERELKRIKLDVSLNNQEAYGQVAKKYNFVSIDDLLASVGYGETSPVTVVHRLMDIVAPERSAAKVEPLHEPPKKRVRKRKSKSPVQIEGIQNLMIKFAKCCLPVRGDEIVGYVTLGKGVSIHRKNCPSFAALSKNKERIVNVFWSEESMETLYGVQLAIEAWDRPGLVADVLEQVNERKIIAKSCLAWTKPQGALVKLAIDVKSKDQMEELIKGLNRIKGVSKVYRIAKKTV